MSLLDSRQDSMTDYAPPIRPVGSGSLGDRPDTLTVSRDEATARTSARISWLPDALGLAGVLLITAILSWHRLWLENGLAYLDVVTFYMPWYAHLGEAIRAFDIPGWNPYQFSGTPFAGDPQSGWWYFPAMAIFSIFDPVPAYQAYIIFHLAFAGVTTYIFCRMVGLQVIPAVAAGVAYQSGPFVSHVSCCLIHVQLATWIPAALIGVELVVRGKSVDSRALGWVVTGFAMSQMIAGWPGQGMYNGCLVTGGYLAFRILLTRQTGALGMRDRLIRLVGDGAGILSFAVLWAAAGLLPRLDIVSRTNVAWGTYDGFEADKNSNAWGFYALLDHLFSDNNGYRSLLFYLGAPVVILSVVGVILAWSRPWVPFLTLVTVLTSVMALKPTPVHELFFLLPRYEELHSHVPSRVTAVQWIGPAILAATALDALMRAPSRQQILRALAIGVGFWGLAITLLDLHNWPVEFRTIIAGLLTTGVIALFAILTLPPRERVSRFVPRAQAALALLLLVLVVADPSGRVLGSTLRTGDEMSEVIEIPTGDIPREAIDENDATTDPGGAGEFLQRRLKAGEYVRFFGYNNVLQQGGDAYPTTYRENFGNPSAIDILVNARAMRLHIFDVQGYNPVQLRSYVEFLNELNGQVQNYHDAQILPGGLASPLLDLLNARYIIVPNEAVATRPRTDIMLLIASYPEVFRNDSVRILENRDAMPRAWLAHDIRYADPAQIPAIVSADGFDPASTVVLGGEPADSVERPAPAGPESVEIVRYEDDTVVLEVTAAADGMLVLSETFERGWHATVDGERVPVEQAYGVVRAVPVTAGTHTVELTYDPWSLRYGLYVSLAGAALSIAVIVTFIVRRQRGHHSGDVSS